jgi:hypothetical protein
VLKLAQWVTSITQETIIVSLVYRDVLYVQQEIIVLHGRILMLIQIINGRIKCNFGSF